MQSSSTSNACTCGLSRFIRWNGGTFIIHRRSVPTPTRILSSLNSTCIYMRISEGLDVASDPQAQQKNMKHVVKYIVQLEKKWQGIAYKA